MRFIERLAEKRILKRQTRKAARVMGEIFLDLGIVQSKRELRNLSARELLSYYDSFGKRIAGMLPNDLQDFVNEKLEGIVNEDRRINARIFLQDTIREFKLE